MKKKKRWPRDEALYNKVQENEFLNFFEYVKWLGLKVCKNAKIRNYISCLLIWHKFPNLSARRAKSFLLLFKKFKIINANIPCFKTLCNYRAEPIIWRLLEKLIEESSKPLSTIEHDFATDMAGIRTTLFTSWFSIRAKKRIQRRDHLRDHLTAGIKSMIVPAADICMSEGEDNTLMRKHVDRVAENFTLNDWTGDSKYWARENCRKVAEKRGKPYFKCREGKTAWNGKQSGVPVWKEMNKESKEHPRRYKEHYRYRVKAECTIHSKKALHGDKAYSRLPSARENEGILRWINHNINVLNRARIEWGIIPKFIE